MREKHWSLWLGKIGGHQSAMERWNKSVRRPKVARVQKSWFNWSVRICRSSSRWASRLLDSVRWCCFNSRRTNVSNCVKVISNQRTNHHKGQSGALAYCLWPLWVSAHWPVLVFYPFSPIAPMRLCSPYCRGWLLAVWLAQHYSISYHKHSI